MSAYNFLTVQSGSAKSGCKGFPFPIDKNTPPNTDFYPLTLPKGYRSVTPVTTASAARWVWRARRWTVTSNATVSNGTDSFGFPTGQLPDFFNNTDETEIVLATYGSQAHTETTAVYQIEFTLFLEVPGTPKLWLDGANHKPYLEIFGGLSTTDGAGNEGFLQIATREARLSGGIADGSFTGTVDGVNVTIYYLTSSGGTGSASVSTFAINPTTFWSWDGKFNTSTGNYA
jgi:hypothetical protein